MSEITERCNRLIAAFGALPVERQDRACLTPNDAATVADLAQYILEYDSELAAALAERDALLGWLIFQPHSPLSGGGWEVRGLKTQYLFVTYEAARAALDAALKAKGGSA